MCLCGGGKEQKTTNIILITLDTVRADHLGSYGNKKIKTPNLDRLAREGMLFENAITSAPITLPAHASIFTGLYPFRINVRNNGTYMLADNSITLAGILQKNGYRTAAFISAAVVRSVFNLDQGFELYDEKLDHHRLASGEYVERRADSVTKTALAWLNSSKDNPYFAWIHYYDPHSLYEPPEPFLSQYKQNPYDGEIAYVDSQLADIIKFAREQEKTGKKVLVIVVADHGEGLWDHGEPEHGIFLYQETVRVPLIFTWFPEKYKAHRIAEVVRTVDIMPTIIEYLSLPLPKESDGISLLPLIEQKKGWKENFAYSETLLSREDFGWSQLFSIQDNNWKYIFAPRPELYDMKNDIFEKKNVVDGTNNAVTEKMKQQLTALSVLKFEQKPNPVPISPEDLEKLASLGYAGQPRTDRKMLADPKDQLPSIKLMHQAGTLFMQSKYKDCIPLLLEALKPNEENRQALLFLTEAFLATGNIEEAIKYAKKNIRIGDVNGILHFNLGNIYYKIGNSTNAESYYRKAVKINPYFSNPLFNLAYLEFQRGKINDARERLLKALKIKDQNANAHYLLGAIEAQDNDLKSAIQHFSKAVEIDPLHREAWKNLANAYYIQKDYQKSIDIYQQAIKVQPNADLYLKIASIYFYDLNDKTNALVYYKRTLGLVPEHPDKVMIHQMISVIENK